MITDQIEDTLINEIIKGIINQGDEGSAVMGLNF